MKKLILKTSTGFAVGALAISMFATAAMADNEITGNGAKSTNTISIVNTCAVSVAQSNISNITAKVDQSGSTGGNTASSNTGGDVSITTGDVNQTATVTVDGSSNTIETLPSCCGCQESSPANNTITDNGVKSANVIADVTSKTTGVAQSNASTIKAKVKQTAKTGKNKSNKNTNGTTTIGTGVVTSGATVGVTGSTNTL